MGYCKTDQEKYSNPKPSHRLPWCRQFFETIWSGSNSCSICESTKKSLLPLSGTACPISHHTEWKRESYRRASSKTFIWCSFRSPSKAKQGGSRPTAFPFSSPTHFLPWLPPPTSHLDLCNCQSKQRCLRERKKRRWRIRRGKINPFRIFCTLGFTQQNYLNANLTPVAFQSTQPPGHPA